MNIYGETSRALLHWRERLDVQIEAKTTLLVSRLWNKIDSSPASQDPDEAGLLRITEKTAADDLFDFTNDVISGELGKRAHPAQVKDLAISVTDVVRRCTPEPLLILPKVTFETASWKWVIPAAIGAILGVLLFPRLTQLCWGDLETGKFLGGPAGAVIFVALTALASENREIRLVIQGLFAGHVAAEAVSIFLPIRKVWNHFSFGNKRDPWTIIKRVIASLSIILVLQVMAKKPKRLKEFWLESLHTQIRNYYLRLVDTTIVLAVAAIHLQEVESTNSGKQSPDDEIPALFNRIGNSLNVLVMAANAEKQDQQRTAIEQFLSSLEAQGIRYESIPDGALYNDEMDGRFKKFGVVNEGEPVVMLRPAWIRGNRVLRKGEIQKKRR